MKNGKFLSDVLDTSCFRCGTLNRSLRLRQDHRFHQQNRPVGLLSAESPLFDRY